MQAATVTDLVRRASGGDQRAWDEIVERYAALVWSIAGAHRLSPADAADVSQVTWLRLVENLDRLQQPEALAGWIGTTARRECLAVLRRDARQVPTDTIDLSDPQSAPGEGQTPDARLLGAELVNAVRVALESLAPECQLLLRLLTTDPPLSYDEISAAVGRPVGSIGPTRARCLARLRSHPGLAGIRDA